MPESESIGSSVQDRWLWVIDEKLVSELFGEEPTHHALPEQQPWTATAPTAPTEPASAAAEPVIEPAGLALLNSVDTAHPEAPEAPASPAPAPTEAQDRDLGRPRDVSEELHRPPESNPEPEGTRTGLGWSLLNLSKAEEALPVFEEQLRLNPSDGGASRGRAQALHRLSRYDEAKEEYRRILEDDPANSEVLANLITISAGEKDSVALRQYCDALLKVKPRSRQALAGLLSADILDRKFEAAFARGKAFVEVEPGSYEAWFNMGLAAEEQGRLEEAEDAYRHAIQLNGQQPGAYLNLGALLFRAGNAGLARPMFEKVLELQPKNVDALWNIGLTDELARRFESAEKSFAAVSKADPDNAEPWFHLGYARFQNHQWTEAIDALERSASRKPEWVEPWIYSGLAYWMMGGLELAQTRLDTALELDPHHLAALQCRTALALYMRDLGTAPELEAQLADLGHTTPEFCYNLGCLQYASQMYDAAAQSFRRAIAKRPTFSAALVNLGHALEKAGRTEEARETWRNAVGIDPALGSEYFSLQPEEATGE